MAGNSQTQCWNKWIWNKENNPMIQQKLYLVCWEYQQNNKSLSEVFKGRETVPKLKKKSVVKNKYITETEEIQTIISSRLNTCTTQN